MSRKTFLIAQKPRSQLTGDANEKVSTCQKVNGNNPDLCVPDPHFNSFKKLPMTLLCELQDWNVISRCVFVIGFKCGLALHSSSDHHLAGWMNFFSFLFIVVVGLEFVSGVKLKMENLLAALKPFSLNCIVKCNRMYCPMWNGNV